MPFEGKPHFVGRHPAAVVGDLDQFEPPGGKPDSNRRGAGIEGVFNKLLEGARRALYDLASGDAIHELGRQPSY